jgi:hypothetical protein
MGDKGVKEADLYVFLEKKFVATFLDELIPGIFHNFANPLNGIMGRSKLMQRRLDEFVRKIEKRYPDIENEIGADYKKLISDINAISNESEKFFDMFRVATGKFYTLGTRGVEKLNLSSLIEAELGFGDFYMDYKHNTKKDIHLDMEVPYISVMTSFYSIALWVLIRQATKNVQKQNGVFRIATAHDDQWVIVRISHIGSSLLPGWQEISLPLSEDSDPLADSTDEQRKVLYALLLFKQGVNGIEMTHDGDSDLLTIRIPYHQ